MTSTSCVAVSSDHDDSVPSRTTGTLHVGLIRLVQPRKSRRGIYYVGRYSTFPRLMRRKADENASLSAVEVVNRMYRIASHRCDYSLNMLSLRDEQPRRHVQGRVEARAP